MTMRQRVILAGMTTRAMASSAIAAGHSVIAVDAFGDLDHPAAGSLTSLPRDFGVAFTAARAALVASHLPAGAAAYAASFENDPEAVERLGRGRALWGNSAAILDSVRNPLLVSRALREAGLPTPAVRSSAPRYGRGHWLLKPRRSGGGQRIQPWQGSGSVPRWGYLQEAIAGTPGSLLFVANGRRMVPIGLTRQLIGDRRFGATGFRYVGNLLGSARSPLFPRESELLARIVAAAEVVTERFGLVGVNGIDFIARGGIPYPVEVNPRWTGAMELTESAYGLPLFAWHRDSCAGALPAFALDEAREAHPVHGKAIVFTRESMTAGDTRRWLGETWIADIPQPGETIRAGHPACTVFGTAATGGETVRRLLAGQRQFLDWARKRRRSAA
ncbi:MAG TPA: ATP-grasp domain-containing protein [Gemmatimonadales bacterium]|nr:ATP-grasp domain-containing protein [Gemmatimonadales bacterium]